MENRTIDTSVTATIMNLPITIYTPSSTIQSIHVDVSLLDDLLREVYQIP
jgi:hypothetical protein